LPVWIREIPAQGRIGMTVLNVRVPARWGHISLPKFIKIAEEGDDFK
jgi:hypothetical protein